MCTFGASRVVLVVKNLPVSAGDIRDMGSIPGSGRFPWRRAGQPTLVFLPGESHGQRSLSGYSPWGGKELDTTEPLTLSVAAIHNWKGSQSCRVDVFSKKQEI